MFIAAAISFPAVLAKADTIQVYSTGMLTSLTQQADGLADLHYALLSAPAGATAGSAFVTDQSGYPFPIWAADDASSKWISPQPSYTLGQTDLPGQYVYQTSFSLSGLNPRTASLSLQIATDNATTDVLLNGISTGITYSGLTTKSAPFTISSGFVAGLNTLTFVTQNFDGDNTNPTGINVQISGTADSAAPEPSTAALVFGGVALAAIGIFRRKVSA